MTPSRLTTACLFGIFCVAFLHSAGASRVLAAGDKIQGTLTVNGKTRLLKYVYVGRAADPDRPASAYLIALASDAEVPETAGTMAGNRGAGGERAHSCGAGRVEGRLRHGDGDALHM
jgi:hypothetical protein